MAKVESKTATKTPMTSNVAVSVRVESAAKQRPFTLDDFTSEYREVLNELLALQSKKVSFAASTNNATQESIVEQAVMRIVHVGQKQRIAPAKIKQMVTGGAESARGQRNWQPQKALERSSDMLAGSSRLRKT